MFFCLMHFIIFILVSFITGLVVGSFLNVVILRGARGEGLGGRSRCDKCAKALGWKELIPIVSFLFQKGRCRGCGAALLWQYPLVETATALAYAVAIWRLAPYLSFDLKSVFLIMGALVAVSAGVVIIVSDLRFQIIPNGAVGTLLALGVAATVLGRGIRIRHPVPGADLPAVMGQAIVADVAAAAVLAGTLFLLWFFSRGRWMGLGDPKLIFATSLLIGFPQSLAAFLFSFWLGGIAGGLLLAAGRKGLKSRIPLGPFIIAGTLLAYFLSDYFFTLTGFSLLF